MARFLKNVFPSPNAGKNEVCLAQFLAGAGNLLLNGTLNNPIKKTVPFIEQGYARSLSFSSPNDCGTDININGLQNFYFLTSKLKKIYTC